MKIRSSSGIAVATVLVAGLLGASAASSQAADVDAIPSAPVLTVIPSSLTLPFTIDGDADIEVAVLTGGADPATAVWQATDELALAPYLNTDIRVLARAAGQADQSKWFDATYQVRSSFPPAQGQTIEGNPFVGVAGNDPRIRGWASGWSDVAYGPNVVDSWKTPQNAVGPVGGTGYEGNTSVVVLGDHGHITMTFDSPIHDGPGYDIVVFENGFRVNGSQFQDFLELGNVEVSSNGEDFVAFDTGTTRTSTVGAYAGSPATDFGGGIVGRDLNGYGTPVDLAALTNKAEVRDGTVDLDAITHVKIVDIVGDGNDLDSFGKPIYDPFPTFGSGGFDLRGVGVLNQTEAAVTLPAVAGVSTTSVSVTGQATTGLAGDQSVRLEVATQADHSDATTRGTTTVTGSAITPLAFTVDGLTPGTAYHYRFVSTSADASETATPWRTFTKTKATLGNPTAPTLTRTEGTSAVTPTVRASVNPQTDGPQSVTVEHSPYADHSGAQVTEAQTVTATQTVAVPLPPIAQGGTHHYRFVSTSSDGVRLEGPWSTVVGNVNATISATVPFRWPGAALVRATVAPGTKGAQTVVVERATNSGFTQNLVTSAPITVSAATVSKVVDHVDTTVDDVTNYYYRVRATSPDATSVQSGSQYRGVATAPVHTLTPGATTATTASIGANLTLGTHGPRTGTLQLSTSEDHADAIDVQTLDLTANRTTPLEVADLEPGTTYWARVTTTGTLSNLTTASSWVSFTTTSVTDGLTRTEIARTGYTTADVEVDVTAAATERSVLVEVRQGDEVATATTAQTVAAGTGTQTLTFPLSGLAPATAYEWRVVTTLDGHEGTTPWTSFTTTEAADDACEGDDGVTVVVDYGAIAPAGGEQYQVACAPGDPATGIEALQDAGFTLGWVPGFENGAICTIDALPAAGFPTCWFDGYWSYWHAEPGEAWTYSNFGAGNRDPEAGSVEGWRYVSLQDPSTPPVVGPTFVEGVDVTKPVITFDADVPTSATEGQDVTFAYTIDDQAAVRECRLDDGDWAPCDVPAGWSAGYRHVVKDVAVGEHTLHIRATDTWGNVGTQSTSFTVSEIAAPTVDLTGPASVVSGQSATFTVTTSGDSAIDTVERRVGDGEWVTVTDGTFTLSGLAVGTHTIEVRATNVAGKTGTDSATLTVTEAPVAPPVNFNDVAGNTFKAQIEWLVGKKITTGYDNGNGTFSYRGSQPVLREQMAAFLYRLENNGANPPASATKATFRDVPGTHAFTRHIAWLSGRGVTEGYTDNTFRGSQPVLREQMAAFLYRLAGKPNVTLPSKSPFVDVPTSHTFYKEIVWLSQQKITEGYKNANGTYSFRGGQPVLREQMAAFLFRYDALPKA